MKIEAEDVTAMLTMEISQRQEEIQGLEAETSWQGEMCKLCKQVNSKTIFPCCPSSRNPQLAF
jgi:hypothetical protein